MKTKHLFMTFGVALAMGMATMSSCAVREAMAVNADSVTVNYVGSSNSWNTSADPFTLNEGYYTFSREFAVNDLFKVYLTIPGDSYSPYWVAAHWEGISKCEGIVDDNTGDHNFKVTTAGNYTIKVISTIATYDSKGYGVSIIPTPAEKKDPVEEYNTFYVRDKASVLGEVANVKVYAWDEADEYKHAAWPGEHTGVTTETLGNVELIKVSVSKSYDRFIVNNGTNQTDNVVVEDNVGKVIVIDGVKENTTYNYHVVETSNFTDKPATEGYYVVGDYTEWTFTGATKMGEGDELNHAKLVNFPVVKDKEYKVKAWFDYEVQWFGVGENNENYLADESKAVNIDASKDGHMYVTDYVAPDVPAEDGYYILGLEGWKYADNPVKMTQTDQDGNVAYYLGLTVKVDDEIRVRSYFSGEDKWSEPGNDTEDYGAPNGSNFKFSVAGTYDIYAKYEEDVFKFYVAEQAVTHTVSVYHKLYVGGNYEITSLPEEVLAYEGKNFEYTGTHNGYVLRGVFTDESLTTPYVPTEIKADTNLYAKFTKAGYYVVGDPNWTVDEGFYLTTEVLDPNNTLEGTITVPNTASKEAPVSLKPLNFFRDPIDAEHDYITDYSLGQEYSYAYVDGEDHNNMKFTKGGTFAVYVQINLDTGHVTVWLNEGANAFNTKFLSELNTVCDVEKGNTDFDELKEVWNGLAVAFNDLPEAEQAKVKGGTEGQSGQVLALYDYIVHKYGTGEGRLEDFMYDRADIEPQAQYIPSNVTSETVPVMIIVIASVMLLSVATVTTVIVLKKTRFHK